MTIIPLAGEGKRMSNHRDEVSAAPMPGQDASTSGWILLVGDESETIEAHRQMLDKAGYVCWTAATAGKAMILLEQHASFAIVVSDFALSDMDGPAFGSALRRRFQPWLQLVFLADQVAVETALSALHVGPTDLLEKHPAKDRLLQAIARAGTRAAQWQGMASIDERHLQSLKDEANRLAQRLQTFAGLPAATSGGGHTSLDNRPPATEAKTAAATPQLQPASNDMSAHILRSIIHARSQRNPILSTNRFAAPVWDMLLDLALAWMENRTTSVSSLCIVSGLPQSTALRRIKELRKAGIITLMPDETDGRREFVTLTDQAMKQMVEWLEIVRAIGIQAREAVNQHHPPSH